MLRRAFLWALLAEVLATALMLGSFRLASVLWGTQGLSEWVLVRRIVSLLVPVVSCGLEVSVTLAASRAQRQDSKSESALLIAGMLPVILVSGLFLAITAAFPGAVSRAMFGSDALAELSLAASLIASALGLHVVLYAFLRGTLRMRAAGALHVATFGVLPVSVILWFAEDPRQAMLILAVLTAAMVLLVACGWLLRGVEWSGTIARSRQLVVNGAPRVPAALSLLALFALPTLAVVHLASLEAGALLSLSLTVVTLCGSLFTPLSVVLLPVAARAGAMGDRDYVRSQIRRAGLAAILFGAVTAAAAALLAAHIAHALLGRDDPVLARLIAWSALAGAPYIYFVCNRPLVDAHCPSTTVTRIAGVALAAAAASFAGLVYLAGQDALGSALAAHIISIWVLAAGTHRELRRVLAAGRV